MLTNEIFRETDALLTDTWVGGLMSMMVNRRKMAKKDGLEQFQRQKAGSRSLHHSIWDLKRSKNSNQRFLNDCILLHNLLFIILYTYIR